VDEAVTHPAMVTRVDSGRQELADQALVVKVESQGDDQLLLVSLDGRPLVRLQPVEADRFYGALSRTLRDLI
jgi:hypothetical protein